MNKLVQICMINLVWFDLQEHHPASPHARGPQPLFSKNKRV